MAHMGFFCLLHKAPSWCRSTRAECCPSDEAAARPPHCTSSAPDGSGKSRGEHGPLGRRENKHCKDQPREAKVNDLHSLECKKKNGGQQKSNSKLSCWVTPGRIHLPSRAGPEKCFAFILFQQVLANICQQEGILPDNTTAWIHTGSGSPAGWFPFAVDFFRTWIFFHHYHHCLANDRSAGEPHRQFWFTQGPALFPRTVASRDRKLHFLHLSGPEGLSLLQRT